MIRTLAAALATSTCIVALATPVAAQTLEYNIPAGPLKAALDAYVRQSGRQVVYRADEVRSARSPGVRGTLSTDAALAALLAGSGFTTRIDGKLVAIVKAGNGGTASSVASSGGASPGAGGVASALEPDENDDERNAIVVTGTRIKGARPTSPVVTITQEEMRLAGHNNLGEAIRALPQNFAGGQNPGVLTGAAAGGAANQNITGSSSLNLRGLGPGATLTLLNGSRLPYDGFVQAIDVSSIPIAAVDRVEILLDGASAIYGSDAVGGVANIVLKRDYKGVEISTRFGTATDGGLGQQQYSAVGGTNWGSGGFLVTGDYSNTDPVLAKQRNYLDFMPTQEVTLYPAAKQASVLFSGHQVIAHAAELSIDAFYTDRHQESLLQSSTTFISESTIDTEIWGVTPALNFALPQEWTLRLRGTLGRSDTEQTTFSSTRYINKVHELGIETEGPTFSLPGGDARLSVGGGYRRNSLTVSGRVEDVKEASYYLYAEADLPLISKENNIPLMSRFTLNVAVRHEKYDSYGASTTPKIGAIWTVTEGFDVKASWGRSFKVPTLLEQNQPTQLLLFPGSPFVGAPAGTQVMAIQGGNPLIGPERAEVITAGFVVQPKSLPGLSVEFSWFDIDYTDRVEIPITPFSQALVNAAFADFVTLDPTVAEQNAAFGLVGLPVGSFTFNISGGPYDPTTIAALVDRRNNNTAQQHVRGIDLTARYVTSFGGGRFSLDGNLNWITDSTRSITALAPELPTVGVIYFPPDFKARAGAYWSRNGLTLSSIVNHIAGVKNTNLTPSPKGGPMTTLDLVVDYQAKLVLIGDVGFTLAVTNAFNEKPPFLQPLQPFNFSFDSTNYSPLGRVVGATIRKRF